MASNSLPDAAPACKTCRFRGAVSVHNKNLFACRRFPPTVQVVVDGRTFQKDHYKGITTWSEKISDVSFWPMVVLDAWCGEYAESEQV